MTAIAATLENIYVKDMARTAWLVLEDTMNVIGPKEGGRHMSRARVAASLRKATVTFLRKASPTMKNEAMREVVWNELQARRMTWAKNGTRKIANRVLRFLMHV